MKNQLKTIALAIGLCSAILISSCGSDDSGPDFDFKDQNLQGVIDGLPFVFGEGTVEELTLDGGVLSFRLYHSDELFDDACDFFSTERVSVTFTTKVATGVTNLFFDINSFDGEFVSLINPSSTDGFPLTSLASIGAIEILSITDSEVTGRLDATLDAENTVNGNFTVNFCSPN
ncbi:MAG: hypothetical protein ABJG47_18385 [Ekhidna sp.]